VRRWGRQTAATSAGASRRLLLLPAALLLLALAPAGAQAETRTFLNSQDLFPSGNVNGTFGPAGVYPSTITVAGLTGTVTKATVTILGLASGSPADIDMAIVGPNGQQVMLMSDACGGEGHSLSADDWTFDDTAPTFLSQLACSSGQDASFKPTNYFEESPVDDLSVKGGPAGPYLNSLTAFAGADPNGAWNLFVLDDNAAVIGFVIDGWALNLEVEPPPVAAPVFPAPVVMAPVVPVVPPAAAKPTGKRAAALVKCKTKKTKKARKKCRRHAQTLPL
jgi:hypothetical protein